VQPTIERWNESLCTAALYEIEHHAKHNRDGAYRWHHRRGRLMYHLAGLTTYWE
jgi:hypothetical protein